MSCHDFSDEMFEKMIELAMRSEMERHGEEYDDILPDEQHVFSPAFEKKMKKLLRVNPKVRRRKLLKNSVAVALVVMSLSFVGLMSVEAVRSEVFKIILDWKGKYIDVIFEGANSHNENILLQEDVKHPQYIPAEYVFSAEDSMLSPGMSILVYRNDTDSQIKVTQMFANSSGNMSHDAENLGPEDIYINGQKAIAILSLDGLKDNSVLWNDGKFSFSVSGSISLDELVRIAESLK